MRDAVFPGAQAGRDVSADSGFALYFLSDQHGYETCVSDSYR